MFIKKIKSIFTLIILLCLSLQTFAQQKPNIIIILADDMGYGDLGCYGQQMIQTPHIDSLAAAGMRFTDYYAGCTVCAPSRESMLTGMTTGHTFIRGNFLTDQQEDPAMPSAKVTIAELLKEAGYKTGIYGKWGLGGEGYGPETQGFDSSLCYLDQIKAHNYYPPYLYDNGKRKYIKENKDDNHGLYSHDLFVDRTLNFINNNREDQPFFLYLSYTLPHGSYSLAPEEPYRSKDWPKTFKVYATMISKLDKDVGRIMQLLREKGALDNTVILFTSDNGANLRFAKFFESNGPLRGGKRDLYEGGIREPMIAFWPGKIAPGKVSNHITAAWDFLPTLCEIASVKVPDHIDGISFLPTLFGEKQKGHDFLYWEYYQYNYNWYKPGNKLPRNYLTNRAARYGKWKGVQNHIYRDSNAPIELYDLSKDIGEQHDVAQSHPDIVNAIKEIFKKSSTPDAPFFPYKADSVAKLHTFNMSTPQQLKEFFHYTKDRIPFVSSHRGAPTLGYPENCIATFRHTLRHTWSIMEVDPHYTKDSAIILMHDPTLDRTSTGHGKISDYTLPELKKLNLKDSKGNTTKFKIPTLDEALEWAKGKTVLILDQKDVPVEARAEKIIEHHAQSCAMIMCYTYEDAKKVYAMDKNIMMEVFIPNIRKAKEFEATGIPWNNVVAFVTHNTPKNLKIFEYLHDKGVMAIRGSSRNVDKQYLNDEISKKQLESGYKEIIQSGADIIEADLGVQAGKELQKQATLHGTKKKYFIYKKSDTDFVPNRGKKYLLITDQSENRIAIVDVKENRIVWQWRPEESNIRPKDVKWFKATSDAKVVYGGKYILLTASLGGVALVRISDKKTVFYTNVGGNTHSAELLPDGNIVTASSTGNYLTVVHTDTLHFPDSVFRRKIFLPSAHNVVWDKKRKVLWSAAGDKIYAFKYNFNCEYPYLKTIDSIPFPGSHPHDLFPVFGKDLLWLTTVKGMFKFNPSTDQVKAFKGDITANIKSVSSGSLKNNYPTIIMLPREKWWTDEVLDLHGNIIFKQHGLKMYKVRWLLPNLFSYKKNDSFKICKTIH